MSRMLIYRSMDCEYWLVYLGRNSTGQADFCAIMDNYYDISEQLCLE